MKERKLPSLLAVAISLQMIIAPVMPTAFAEETPAPVGTPTDAPPAGKSTDAPKSNIVSNTAKNTASALGAIGTIWKSVMGQQSSGLSPQAASDMQALSAQQSPQPDKYFNLQKLSMIPGLGEYLALNGINPQMLNCATLPTTLHEANPEVCRTGVTNDKGGTPQDQMNEMFTYHNAYFQVSKVYKNYSAVSNVEGQPIGVGCMENARQILNGFFNYRLDELDKLSTNLEAMQNQLRESTRADLDALEEAVAVLDGDSDIANKVKSRRPDLFDFAKRFNNPACNSMFKGGDLNTKGSSAGLNGLSKEMKDNLSKKVGKFSGESYSKAHSSVVQDLDKLADKVSKQFELNFSKISQAPGAFNEFAKGIRGTVSSTSNTHLSMSPDFFSDVNAKFEENFGKIHEQRLAVQSELNASGINSARAISLLGNTSSSDFDSEVATIENGIKNKCLSDTVDSFGRETIMDKIYDPTASGHANKFASNFMKDKLEKILDNKETSLEKKLAELKSLESQTGSRYYLKMENSYEVQEVDASGKLVTKVVNASTQRTPAVFFSDLVKNCNAQFKANKLDNKMTGAGAIQKLKQLKQDYSKLAKSQAQEMKNDIRKKLIECESPEDANNTVQGSCTPERFNTASPGFCANAALSCSKNMQACSEQAETFTKNIKTEKTARVNNYKAQIAKNKQDVVKLFDSALARYMKDAESLRGIFGAGFTSPTGIQRDVKEGEKYLGEFEEATGNSPDGVLKLENPEKHTEMFKENIKLLRQSVAAQQDGIMGPKSPIAAHINQTKNNYDKIVSQADDLSKRCLGMHDGAIKAAEAQRAKEMEDYKKKMTELGEKRQEFCNIYGMARNNPQAACGEVQSDFIKSSLDSAAMVTGAQNEARDDVAKLSSYCRQFGNFDEKKNGSAVPARELCADLDNYGGKNHFKNTDGTIKANITKACNDLEINCKAVPGKEGASENPLCKETKEKIESNYNLSRKAGMPQSDIVLSDAPAYCAAADGSSNRDPKLVDHFAKTLEEARRASGQ